MLGNNFWMTIIDTLTNFVRADTTFFALWWFFAIILNVCNIYLPFASLDVITDFSEAAKFEPKPYLFCITQL